jgi:PAS domain S-box-containing protein
MVELLDSTKINPHTSKIELDVKAVSTLKPTFSPCGAPLDKHRLEDILENIPSAVVVFEKPSGKVIYANKRAIEIHGKNPCGIELENQSEDLKIYSMDGKPCPIKELYTYWSLFNEETFRNEPLRIERTDGERFIVNISAKPLYDKEGRANGAIAIFDDVTERMQTQEALTDSEERLNMAQSIAHLGSWEYFVKDDRAVWSEELFQIFGIPVSNLVQTPKII